MPKLNSREGNQALRDIASYSRIAPPSERAGGLSLSNNLPAMSQRSSQKPSFGFQDSYAALVGSRIIGLSSKVIDACGDVQSALAKI
jgi:hypothetical protein